MDRALGVLFTLLALPVMGFAAIAIRLESKGPVLFRQQRYGFNNRLIGIYKFRTMYTDRADSQGDQLTAARRSARHPRRQGPAPVQHRRAAATVQRAAGRDVGGGAAAARAQGKGGRQAL